MSYRRGFRRRSRREPYDRAALDHVVDLFAKKYVEWRKLTAPSDEQCPICDAPIRIEPGSESSDMSHAIPFCEGWTLFMLALGAHTPRVTER